MKAKRSSDTFGIRRFAAGAIAVGLVAVTGCSTLDVDTLPAPGANLESRSTFRIVDRTPAAETRGRNLVEASDNGGAGAEEAVTEAMLNNSIMDDAVRTQVARAFESRGYQTSETNPSFEVSFFAGAMHREEFDDWYGHGYGYGAYDSGRYEYTEGVVLIDVRDPLSGDLLWRGSAEALVSDDPEKYGLQVQRAVRKIVERYPQVAARFAEAR
jgi:hypothetical protein